MIEAQLADGSVLEFPEGTPDAAIDRAVKQQIAPKGKVEETKDGPPQSLDELSSGFLTRPLFVTAGSLAGGAAGAAAGPAGALGFGAAGAAGGSFVYDNVEDMLRWFGVIDKPAPTLAERLETGAEEAALDLMFAGGAAVVRPILGGRRLLGKLFGVFDKEATQIRLQAESAGIGLGAVDVGGTVPKTFNKVINVFPFTGTPSREAAAVKQTQVVDRVNSILNTLAPNATLTSELGLQMGEAARGTSKEFKNVSGRLYDRFRDLAKNASRADIIPTEEVRQLATALADDADAGRIFLSSQKALPEAIEDATGEWLKLLTDLPETLTIQQHRGLTEQMQKIMAVMSNEGFDIARAAQMKKALEADLNNIRGDLLPEGEAAEIIDALREANRFYAQGITAFQTPTAKTFERFDRNIFKAGAERAGSLNQDELARVALNLKSPAAVDDLEKLVGRDLLQSAGRGHVESALNAAIETVEVGSETVKILNPAKFEAAIGLGKANEEGLNQVLKKAGFDISDLRDLVSAAKQIEGVADPSTFVKRRVTLGGTAALGAMLGFGGATVGSTGMVGASALALLARKGSQIISSPVALKNMIEALDTARATTARQAALGRIMEFLVRPETDPSATTP